MFRKFFAKEEDDLEEYDAIDPMIEQRRKEKFSTPLIYKEDFIEEEIVIEKKEVKPVVVPQPKPTPIIPQENTYVMSEIISPMMGVQKAAQKKTAPKKKVVKRTVKQSDELVPIISPFYGSPHQEEETYEEVEVAVEPVVQNQDNTVEDRLRHISQVVDDDTLSIIEERTGEFKLNFQSEDSTFIDEIEDSMSLDELMNLYEKRFKD